MRQWRSTVLLAALAALLAACGGGGTTATAEQATASEAAETAAETESAAETAAETEPATEPEAATEAGSLVVAVASSEAGDMLVDGEGRTLYRFLNDTEGASTCVDACLDNWPILGVEGEPEAGEGADAAALGTLTREDGDTQVTYGDWPLYYFAGDTEPGDTNGQGVGDVWYLVAPDGSTIDAS